MKIIYHIPCFYYCEGNLFACSRKKFKAELIKCLHKLEVEYIQLQTVKTELAGIFVDEELMVFYMQKLDSDADIAECINNFIRSCKKYHCDLKQDKYYYELSGTFASFSIEDI